LACRQQLTERIQQTLSSPQCSGALARLRDEFGADSPVAIDNTITLLFAGFDTTSSSLTYMLWLLAQHPDVVQKVRSLQHCVCHACHSSHACNSISVSDLCCSTDSLL
jgi:cytochrome P450